MNGHPPPLPAPLDDIGWFALTVLGRTLRAYQLEIARAILDSVDQGLGLTFTVMMARQTGKNELSAIVEANLLCRCAQTGGTIVKAAPTFSPQLLISKERLEQTLARLPAGLNPAWSSRFGHIVQCGHARVLFLSAQEHSHVVGATGDLLLELDEAQDISEEKYLKDFRPMGATANVTTVLYGTAWTSDTLLARQRLLNESRCPGANFRFDWTALAALSPEYNAFVRAELERLGRDHPLFKTQYALESISDAGRLFDADALSLLQGQHPRQQTVDGARYVAGIDVAGESENAPDEIVRLQFPKRDSTVVTIAKVTYPSELHGEPLIEIVDLYRWTGRDHSTQYTATLELIKRWNCSAVCVDATGVGAGPASWLAKSCSAVEPVHFTRPLKSELAYALQSAVRGGRVRMFSDDGSDEHREFWHELSAARYMLVGNQLMNFYVDDKDGHDDFVTSLALCVRAAARARPEPVSEIIRPSPYYWDSARDLDRLISPRYGF